jgi:hypothetical protein
MQGKIHCHYEPSGPPSGSEIRDNHKKIMLNLGVDFKNELKLKLL